MLLTVPLVSCQLETDRVAMAGVEQHASGLIMAKPKGFNAESTAEGFSAAQEGMLRSPESFTVAISRTDTGIVPRKYFGLLGPRERVSWDEQGGSAGTAYHFEAWRPAGLCWIVIKAQSISETGEPSFLTARAVLDKSSVAGHAGCGT